MRILFLAKRRYTNQDVLSERFGRVYHLPREWRALGHEARLELIDYRSLRSDARPDPGLPLRSHPFLSPLTAVRLLALARRWRPDAVVAGGDCVLGLIGRRLARAAGAPLAWDVYDDYRTFSGYRLFLGWDAWGHLMARADLVLYASRALAEAHAGDGPAALVANAVDPERFAPMPTERARAELGLDPGGVQWIGYFGSMEPDRGVADLVAAVGRLREGGGDVRLLVCGRRHPSTALDRPWIDYRGTVPHTRMPLFVNACDVVAVPYRRSAMMDRGASCKIAEYLACRRPVAATRTPNLLANFPRQAEALGAALAEPGDAEGLARAIRHQLRHGVVAPVPEGMTWAEVARDAEGALRRMVERSRRPAA